MIKNKLNKRLIGIFENAAMPFELPQNQSELKRNIPSWAQFLSDAINQYHRTSFDMGNKPGSSDAVLRGFVLPFVKVARIHLVSKTGSYYNYLDKTVQSGLEGYLSDRLIKYSRYSLCKLANVSVEPGVALSAEELHCLSDLISSICKKPLDLFTEYPVLGRLMSMLAIYWINSCERLLSRFVSDYSEISELHNLEDQSVSPADIISGISDIVNGLSDPHQFGETVAIISFNENYKIVYKPKPLKAEEAFSGLVDWLNKQDNIELELQAIPVIDKGKYGWSKYIDHMPCQNNDELKNFYTRLGMFSALLFLIRGMDYHNDNLIANGEHPYFIDHEMLFYPVYIDPENDELNAKSNSDIQNGYYESVINTRLFPIVETRVDGTKNDVSAIGCYHNSKDNKHLPVATKDEHKPEKHVSSILQGFVSVYKTLMNNKQVLLDSDGPMCAFRGSTLRFNVRSTGIYLSINNLCVVPDSLVSGQAFTGKIHSIRVRLGSIFTRGLPEDMRLEELKILARLDVPRFSIRPTDKHLSVDKDKVFADVLKFSGMELVEQRIKDLSEIDMRTQVECIERSIMNTAQFRSL